MLVSQCKLRLHSYSEVKQHYTYKKPPHFYITEDSNELFYILTVTAALCSLCSVICSLPEAPVILLAV